MFAIRSLRKVSDFAISTDAELSVSVSSFISVKQCFCFGISNCPCGSLSAALDILMIGFDMLLEKIIDIMNAAIMIMPAVRFSWL